MWFEWNVYLILRFCVLFWYLFLPSGDGATFGYIMCPS